MFYDKKIKYVDVYENGEKVQNAGFVRMEVKEKTGRFWIQISGLRSTDTMNCPVVLMSGEKEGMLGEIHLEHGRGVAEFVHLDTDDLVGGIAYDELEDIYIRLGGTRFLRCVVQVREQKTEEFSKEDTVKREVVMPEEDTMSEEVVLMKEDLMPKAVAVSEEVVIPEVVEASEEVSVPEEKGESKRREVKSEAELLKEAFMTEKRLREGESEAQSFSMVREMQPEAKPLAVVREPQTEVKKLPVVREPQPIDKWQQLLAIYPHIRPFDDRREYLLMKPQDFVVLAEKYFSLSENSFLLHGYYNYDHLIMSKERRPEGECFYIGVPGNFYDKEKQVAIMFGFESFEGKCEPARNGDFGYYMIPVEI